MQSMLTADLVASFHTKTMIGTKGLGINTNPSLLWYYYYETFDYCSTARPWLISTVDDKGNKAVGRGMMKRQSPQQQGITNYFDVKSVQEYSAK